MRFIDKFNFVHITVENPFKTWWKARKYFKFPKWKFKFHLVKTYAGYPYATWRWLGKILDIDIHDVYWKDKYNTPRHERNPLIYICLFRKFGFTATPRVYYCDEFGKKRNGDMEYWEYLIQYLYYNENKSLKCYSIWTTDSDLYKSYDENKDKNVPIKMVIPVVQMSLNKKGLQQLKKEVSNESMLRYERR